MKTGAGTWTLAGANSFTAPLAVNTGTLVTKSSAWNVLTNAGGVDVAGGKLVFDYVGASNPSATVLSLLTSARANDFASGQIDHPPRRPHGGLGWLDSGTTFTVMSAALWRCEPGRQRHLR